MNRFAQAINDVTERRRHWEDKIVTFSHQLQEAMGLESHYVEEACHEDVFWTIGEYEIHPQCRCFKDGWVYILEAVPRGTGPSYGYSNTHDPTDDSRWHYRMKGTGTRILAPSIIQEQILQEIRYE